MKIIKFFADCIVTTGANRAVILDIIRGKYYLVPLSLARIITSFDGKEEQELRDAFPEEPEALEEYLDFLEEHELMFWCDSEEEAANFPELNTQWDFPARISNAIVDIKELDVPVFTQIITSLQNLGCQALKIAVYNDTRQEHILRALLDLLEGSAITGLEVSLPFFENAEEHLLRLMTDYPRLLKVFVFAAPCSYISEKAGENLWELSNIIFTTEALSAGSCGQIHWAYFTTNIAHYTESLAHNTCINRKIAVDIQGNIKNCPSMKESFGNIKDTTLEEAINKPGFKKYWNVTKDQISVCKDCEFRHICTDCRAYLEDPEDDYSKPLKCGYDPYTCAWEEWSTHPMKQAAMEHYGIPKISQEM